MPPTTGDDVARGGGREGGRREARRARGNGHPASWTKETSLPTWIVDSMARVTPKHRLDEAVACLERAARAFAEGRHEVVLEEAERAKDLSPREATIRELIGLSAYRLGRWDLALRELRTFRRISGEVAHVPVEMDVLRALERPDEIEDLWSLVQRSDAARETLDEARVVYGSFLIDRDQARRAWEVTGPQRLAAEPRESELRVWYVAARAAHLLGDTGTARRILRAIEASDPAFPGLDELAALLAP